MTFTLILVIRLWLLWHRLQKEAWAEGNDVGDFPEFITEYRDLSSSQLEGE